MPETRAFLLKDNDIKDSTGQDCCYGVLTYIESIKRFDFYIKPGYPLYHYPPFVMQAVECGHKKLSQDFMRRFIKNRLIPPNRQNIRSILYSVGLETYDEFGMLLAQHGKCCQDWMYIEEISLVECDTLLKEWDLERSLDEPT